MWLKLRFSLSYPPCYLLLFYLLTSVLPVPIPRLSRFFLPPAVDAPGVELHWRLLGTIAALVALGVNLYLAPLYFRVLTVDVLNIGMFR